MDHTDHRFRGVSEDPLVAPLTPDFPPHRSVLYGRTFSTAWEGASMDPIDRPTPNNRRQRRAFNTLLAAVALFSVAAIFYARTGPEEDRSEAGLSSSLSVTR